MRSDERIQETKDPNINLKSFIYKNYKDIIAFFIFLTCIFVFIFCEKATTNVVFQTALISAISGSLGFIFGKNVQ